MSEKALVVLSGGQDSVTCLHEAISKFGKDNVEAVSFRYGQKHDREVKCAEFIAQRNDIRHWILTLPHLSGSSPLVQEYTTLGKYKKAADLPGGVEPTFVPGRNILFLAAASNLAGAYGLEFLYTGVCEEDFGGYPDCRADFISAMEHAIGLGLGVDMNRGVSRNDDPVLTSFNIVTPLMHLTKKDTVLLAKKLGGKCWEDLAYSHTCYSGDEIPCCTCHACILRIKGFVEAGLIDPLLERHEINQARVWASLK